MVDKAFAEISPKMQARLLELRAQGSALKGSSDPEAEALAFFARKKPKSERQWSSIRYFLMMRIDKARKKHGLPPIHFE